MPGPVPGSVTESYEVVHGRLVRRIDLGTGETFRTDFGSVPSGVSRPSTLAEHADRRLLRMPNPPYEDFESPAVTIADLFSGIGCLSLGVIEAARAVGLSSQIVLAADTETRALDVLASALPTAEGAARVADLGNVLSGRTKRATAAEKRLLGRVPDSVDVLVAGPPCQGHSRLNNHTRHDDPRNDLYGCVARFVELNEPRVCIVENVDSIVNDVRRSATRMRERLESRDYVVAEGKVALNTLGVPQTRRRHVLVATRAGVPSIDVPATIRRHAVVSPERRTVGWAIKDLAGRQGDHGWDRPSGASDENRSRMEWLLSSEGVDLPDHLRPPCHRELRVIDGVAVRHSYRSMYGQLSWKAPAQTITSGYGSMGQGRYVHPSEPRTLTAHEAARLQFIPDFMGLDRVRGRGLLARLIGNVAPMKLSYVIALEAFARRGEDRVSSG